jgi:uncharacterized membrane protein YccC
MTLLSTRTKEAFKTALAMVIAYDIALWMDWDRPHWAGFAVAFISLATVGQSLNKGVMRMLGTLVAAVVALTFISLFPQDRWLFILIFSVYIGFCTYMMGGAKLQYFWFVCGFVTVIICMDAGPNSIDTFQTALVRVEETGLGILVYSLVAMLLWPNSTSADFGTATRNLASTQHQLYRLYLDHLHGQGNVEEEQTLRAKEFEEQIRFSEFLDAAETDSYEVWELRQQWRFYRCQVADLTETMERWRQSFAEVEVLNLKHLLPNLGVFCTELEGRLAEIERMLDNQAPQTFIKLINLNQNESRARRLSHFHKAALTVTLTQLQHMDQVSRNLFETIQDIKGFGSPSTETAKACMPQAGLMVDTDRLAAASGVMATLWLAYLAFIYVNDIPGGTVIVTMATVLGMAMSTMPHIPIVLLFIPAVISVLFAGILYIFLMPQLTSFIGLGSMIFVVTFVICYLFAAPKQALGRAFGLAMFVTIISVSNQQTYSFLSVANTALMLLPIFVILSITAHVPFSPKPERAFLRLLGRFFRSCEYLLSTMRWDPTRTPTVLDRRRKAFHTREVATLPQKLITWSSAIDTKTLRNTTPLQVQAVVTSLEELSFRLHELLEARDKPQADFLVQELLEDIRAWRLRIQRMFQRMSEDPTLGRQKAFRSKLTEIMEHLEQRIEETMDKAAEGQICDKDGENFYRLLGAFRGVSEALVEFAKHANAIDWVRLREARF